MTRKQPGSVENDLLISRWLNWQNLHNPGLLDQLISEFLQKPDPSVVS